MVTITIKSETGIVLVVASFFYFLGFVVFEGLKIPIGNLGEANPFVVLGFVFTFLSFVLQYQVQISKFIKTL